MYVYALPQYTSIYYTTHCATKTQLENRSQPSSFRYFDSFLELIMLQQCCPRLQKLVSQQSKFRVTLIDGDVTILREFFMGTLWLFNIAIENGHL